MHEKTFLKRFPENNSRHPIEKKYHLKVYNLKKNLGILLSLFIIKVESSKKILI